MPGPDKLALAVALGVLAPTALATAQPSPQAGAQPELGETEPECPKAVRGAKVALTPAPRGATLEFTAAGKQNVAELRELMREIGATVEYHSKLADLHPELVEAGDDAIPPVNISISETASGVKLTLQAEETGDASAVLAHAKRLQEEWRKNECVLGSDESQPATAK